VEQYLRMLQDKGGMVNTALAMACTKGFVTNHDGNLLTMGISLLLTIGQNPCYTEWAL